MKEKGKEEGMRKNLLSRYNALFKSPSWGQPW